MKVLVIIIICFGFSILDSLAQSNHGKANFRVIEKYILSDTISNDYIRRARLDSIIYKINVENGSSNDIWIYTTDGYYLYPQKDTFLDTDNESSTSVCIFDPIVRKWVKIQPRTNLDFYISMKRKDGPTYIKYATFYIDILNSSKKTKIATCKIELAIDYNLAFNRTTYSCNW